MSYILTVTLNPCIDKTITLDGFSAGALNRAVSERTDVGGKGINVSKVLKNMNCPTLATGIAFGDVGRSILSRLDGLLIDHDFVISESGNNRQNLKLLDLKTGEITEISGVCDMVDTELLKAFLEKYTSLLKNAELAVISGSVPKGVPADIYATLITIAKGMGVKVILDADGEPLKYGIKASPYMIKPNIHELRRLIHADSDDIDVPAAARNLAGDIDIVAVSMGKLGSIIATSDKLIKASALKIEGGCATGAGDSMVAASAYAIKNGFDTVTLAKYASAAGSATASKEGSEVCTLDEILNGSEKIEIKELKF